MPFICIVVFLFKLSNFIQSATFSLLLDVFSWTSQCCYISNIIFNGIQHKLYISLTFSPDRPCWIFILKRLVPQRINWLTRKSKVYFFCEKCMHVVSSSLSNKLAIKTLPTHFCKSATLDPRRTVICHIPTSRSI